LQTPTQEKLVAASASYHGAKKAATNCLGAGRFRDVRFF
jgi:hypothetical protein